MKNFITTVLLVCAFASTAATAESESNQRIRIGADVGYSWTAMDQINKQLNNGDNEKSVHSGVYGMLNIDMFLAPFLAVGARTGLLFCQPANANYNYVIYNQTTTIKTSLVPLEAGLSANFKLPTTPLSMKAGIYGGYGFAFASFNNDISALGQSTTFSQPFDGGNFVGELLAALNLKLSSTLSINLNSGYRFANIQQMKQSQDVSYTGIPGVNIPIGEKGDILKNSDNKDMSFDYSGFNIGIGFSLGF